MTLFEKRPVAVSPSHRAGVAFLRGGLFAVVTLLAAGRIGGIARDAPTSSVAGLLVPCAIGGTAAGRAVDEGG